MAAKTSDAKVDPMKFRFVPICIFAACFSAIAYLRPPPDERLYGEVAVYQGVASDLSTNAVNEPMKRIGLDGPPPSQSASPSFTLEDLRSQVPQDAEGNFLLTVPSLCTSTGDPELMKVLNGQPVTVDGRIFPENKDNPDGRRLRLLFIQVSCCAVDARPYSIVLEFAEKAPAIKAMTSVKACGILNYRTEAGKLVPFVAAKRLEEADSFDAGIRSRRLARDPSNPVQR